ncbi:MAG: murein transglycosylase A [Bdellovibrio sp.]|nr:murein transglycosylase A [Methylotenera sp.]
MKKSLLLISVLLLTASCTKQNVKPTANNCDCKQLGGSSSQKPDLPPNNVDIKPVSPINTPEYALLKPAKWEDIDGFATDDLSAAWPAWLQSCGVLNNKVQMNQQAWQAACNAAWLLKQPKNAAIIDYLTDYFNVYAATNADASDIGLVTGYYEPLLKGSRTKSANYPYPLYKQPADLITVDLAQLYPELKGKRVRGKLVQDKSGHNKLVPYATRADIETASTPLAGQELVWIDDLVDGFFLQVQGSGIVKFENGQQMHVGYADQNGHAYNSIGRILIERGELTKDQAGMQGIKNWAKNNPSKLRELLNANPSYVFFTELPAGLSGPLGALGVPLAAERSVAIDPKYVPLGAPLFLSTSQPNSQNSLKRFMVAQDTGGAIKGGVRIDYFWGAGDAAGKMAGSMKQQGKIWVLLPKGFVLPNQ